MVNNITIKTWFSIRVIMADKKNLIVSEKYANWIWHEDKVHKFDTKEKLEYFMDQVQKKYNLF